MKKSISSDEELFSGLAILAESSFPKVCANCNRTYQSVEDFFTQTRDIGNEKSGLKQSWDDNDVTIVEVFRNCVCGSTLMDSFGDRRDNSEDGIKRRQKFSELHSYLVSHGVSEEIARGELLKVVRGQGSELLKNFKARAISKKA